MKLLYITNGISGIGGLERVLSVKASYFADCLGYEVHIITLNETSADPFYRFSSRITIHNINTGKGVIPYILSYIKGINKIVRAVSPDIISVCDDGLKGLYVPIWIKKHKASVIYERHASLSLNNSSIQSIFIKLGGLLYDKVIVLTDYNRTEWIGKNLKVIANPLSFKAGQQSRLDNKQIICVGSLSYNKGYDLLIKAWGRIADRYPEWKILIYGKGDSSVYDKMMADEGVKESIVFCGSTNDIEKRMLDAAFLVLPSRSEGFGMVLIEAMACGLPCISFDCPCGPRDIIENEKNGLLIPPQDINALADGMSRLMDDKELLHEMGRNAYVSIDRYKIENIASEWNDLFNSLMNKA